MIINAKTLNDLKKIPLPNFLNDFGFVADEKKSTKSSYVMKSKETGERIMIQLNKNGEYTFFSTQYYSGTIIDFLKENKGMTIKDIMKEYLNTSVSINNEVHVLEKKTENITGSNILFDDKYKKYRPATCPYFLRDIGISNSNFNKLRNKGFIKESSFSLVFPFYQKNSKSNDLEVSGIYHYKFKNIDNNSSNKIFEKDSRRALGILTENINNSYVMICEQPIDAISHRELMMKNNKDVSKVTYLYTGGSVGEIFLKELDRFLEDKNVKHLYTGFDNDKIGNKYTDLLKDFCKEREISNSKITPKNNDWQDDLTEKTIKQNLSKKDISLKEYVISMDNQKDKLKLKYLLENSSDKDIRLQTVLKLNDLSILEKSQKHEKDDLIKTAIEEKADKIKNKEKLPSYEYIERCDDFEKLKHFALTDKDSLARLTAIHRIDDDKTLTKIALNEKESRISLIAVKKIDDEHYLNKVLKETPFSNIKEEINNQLKTKIIRKNEEQER